MELIVAPPLLANALQFAFEGKPGSCFFRVKRSSCAAATITPSRTSAAALSW
jgi:hypothetical protein